MSTNRKSPILLRDLPWDRAARLPYVVSHVASARFDIGALVHHRRFGYRGVVADVDATFQGTDEWYERVARSRPPRDAPWYHVLPDGAVHTTYVAERHLEADTSDAPVRHPLVDRIFEAFRDGRYVLRGGTSLTN